MSRPSSAASTTSTIGSSIDRFEARDAQIDALREQVAFLEQLNDELLVELRQVTSNEQPPEPLIEDTEPTESLVDDAEPQVRIEDYESASDDEDASEDDEELPPPPAGLLPLGLDETEDAELPLLSLDEGDQIVPDF